MTIVENEEGDPYNRLLGVKYPKDAQVYLEEAMSDLFGSSNPLIKLSHDEEILAANERAKKLLPNFKKLLMMDCNQGSIYY